MRKSRVLATLLCCMLVACIATGVTLAAYAAEGDTATYTKVPFSKITAQTPSMWNNGAGLETLIDGDKSNQTGSGAVGDPKNLQIDEWLLLEFEEEKTIDRIEITFHALPMHMQAWRAEVSKDNKKWSAVTLKENADSEIFNDSVVQNKSKTKGSLVMDFKPVACKYVRLTQVIKESWGTNGVTAATEIEAFTSGAQAEEADTWAKFDYSCANSDATWKQAGDVSLLNDGNNKYAAGGAVIFAATTPGNATLTITPVRKIVPSFIRIFPNSWEVGVGGGNPSITQSENTYVLAEGALINNQVAKGLKFEGYADGAWTTLREYTQIPSYIFGQNFDISTADGKAFEKIKITITEKGINKDFVSWTELELYGNTFGDFIELNESADFKKTYTEGEPLELAGLKVAHIHDGIADDAVDVTAEMVSGYDPYKVGEQTITVTYNDMTAIFKVTVSRKAFDGKELTLISPETLGNQMYINKGMLTDNDYVTHTTMGTWGHTQFYNFFEPITFTIDSADLSNGKAAVDAVRIFLKTGNAHTSRWMVETSLDKTNWTTAEYISDDRNVIENVAVGLKLPTSSDYITIKFAPVYAKYLRVTCLCKDLDGTNALGEVAEIEAFASTGITVADEAVSSASQSYTYAATSADGSSAEGALNDGIGLYYGKLYNGETPVSDPQALNLTGAEAEQASILFTLDNFVKADKIRLFPDGAQALATTAVLNGAPNPDAFVNEKMPKAFKVEGSADNKNWVLLGRFENVEPYVFAQEFKLSSDYTVKYLRLTIVEVNELGGGFSSFGEIEIFGNAVADFEYEEEYAAQFKEGKLIYSQGEELDVTDLSITVTDNAGGILVQTVNVTADMVKNFTTAQAGEHTATINYNGVECDYDYAVAQIDGVTISKMPDKTVYFVGEELDVTGMEITVNYSYGEGDDAQTGSMVIKNVDKFVTLDTSAANNEAKLTVSYYGKTVTANVVVRDVSGIAINSAAHKTSYYVGGKLDVSGLTVEVTYTDGEKETVNVTAEMVTGFSSAKAAESVTLTITYKGKTATYNVEIKPLSVQDGEETEAGCGCGSVAAGYASFAFAGVVLAIAFALAMKRKRA